MKFSSQKGYTLLFSVIVASLVLAIAAFIIQVSRKQLLLSSVWRDSTKAVYAAESGIQCAVTAFASNAFSIDNPGTFICRDVSQAVTFLTIDETSQFKVSQSTMPPVYLEASNSCFIVDVTVTETYPAEVWVEESYVCENVDTEEETCELMEPHFEYQGETSTTTKIRSRGYNLGNKSANVCPAQNPRTLERAINLQYKY